MQLDVSHLNPTTTDSWLELWYKVLAIFDIGVLSKYSISGHRGKHDYARADAYLESAYLFYIHKTKVLDGSGQTLEAKR